MLERAVTPDLESLNSNKKGAKLPLLSSRGLSRLTGWAALPSDNIPVSGLFLSRVEKPSDAINSHLFLMNKNKLISNKESQIKGTVWPD